jgi:hypothetical protein
MAQFDYKKLYASKMWPLFTEFEGDGGRKFRFVQLTAAVTYAKGCTLTCTVAGVAAKTTTALDILYGFLPYDINDASFVVASDASNYAFVEIPTEGTDTKCLVDGDSVDVAIGDLLVPGAGVMVKYVPGTVGTFYPRLMARAANASTVALKAVQGYAADVVPTTNWTEAISSIVTLAAAAGGTSRSIWGKMITFTSLTSGTIMGVRGETVVSASCAVSGSYVYGTQGKLTLSTGSSLAGGSQHYCGVMGQLDLSGGTTTSGHIACIIASIQDTTSTERTAVDGIYVELPAYGSGAKMNSVLKGYGGAKYGFDLSGNHIDYLFTIPTTAAGSKVDADIAYAHYKKMPVDIGGTAGWILIGLDA